MVPDFLQLFEDLESRRPMLVKILSKLPMSGSKPEAREQLLNDWVNEVGEADPTATKEFSTWIANLVVKKAVRLPEDAQKLRERLSVFAKLKRTPAFKQGGGQADIMRYPDFATLAQTIEKFSDVRSKGEVVRNAQMTGAKDLGVHSGYNVVQVTTSEAAAKLFRHTEWCVKDPSYFNEYAKQDPNFWYLYKKAKRGMTMGDTAALPPAEQAKIMAMTVNQRAELMVDSVEPYALYHYGSDQCKDVYDAEFPERRRWEIHLIICEARGVPWYYEPDMAIHGLREHGMKADAGFEEAILKDFNKAMLYALQYKRERWPELEAIMPQKIAEIPEFKQGEGWGSLTNDAVLTEVINYMSTFNLPRDPELEKKLLDNKVVTDGGLSAAYAIHVIKGPWPEAEPKILTDLESCVDYATLALKRPWPELEEKSYKLISIRAMENYLRYFPKSIPRIEAGIVKALTKPDESATPGYVPSVSLRANAMNYAISFIDRVTKGKSWPELEDAIRKLPEGIHLISFLLNYTRATHQRLPEDLEKRFFKLDRTRNSNNSIGTYLNIIKKDQPDQYDKVWAAWDAGGFKTKPERHGGY